MPDAMRGRELMELVWDDQAGTVHGTHSDVPWFAEMLAAPAPLILPRDNGRYLLADPAHRAEDFVALLGANFGNKTDAHLPASLRGVEPTRPELTRIPAGAVH